MKIDAERPGVGSAIILVRHAFVARGLDRTLTQIGSVAEVINLLLFRRRLSQAVIDLIQQVLTPSGRSRWFGRGSHVILLNFATTYARKKLINSFLTKMQR